MFSFLYNPSSSQAQSISTDATAFHVQQFRPNIEPQGLLQTQSPDTIGQYRIFLGSFLHFSLQPLFLESSVTGSKVDVLRYQVGADIGFGFGILSWLDLSVVLPLTLHQDGELPASKELGNASGRDLTGFAISDLKVQAKLQLLHQEKQGLSLSIQPGLSFPTGNEQKFNGEETLCFNISLLLGRTFQIGNRLFGLFANVGYRYLPETNFLVLSVGHEFFFNAGLSMELVPEKFELIVEANGSLGLSNIRSFEHTPVGGSIGGRWFPLEGISVGLNFGIGFGIIGGYGSPKFRAFLGLVFAPLGGKKGPDKDGDLVTNRSDQCPDEKGDARNAGCPWSDKDGDKIPDRRDRCPMKSGLAENEGCPITDTDGDGILDSKDRCPMKPGPIEGKGCPPIIDIDGDGIADSVDRCPKQYGPESQNGCPLVARRGDRDGDGIPDAIDRCPDKAGSSFKKGCPDKKRGRRSRRRHYRKGPDRDRDGIPNRYDRCPNLKGSRRRRGCPRKVYAHIKRNRIHLKKSIHFVRVAGISQFSRMQLNQVAKIMRVRPKLHLKIVTISFHKSRKGWVGKLSFRRADAIKMYLRKRGVSRKRMSIRATQKVKRRSVLKTVVRFYIR